MKRIILASAFVMLSTSAFAADVGVSVTVGEPGFYGHIEIGDAPQPRVIYRQPVIIQRAPVTVVQQPLYLRVPPGHAKNWRKHCAKYDACGVPVYFVQDSWYNQVYVPHYHEHHDEYEHRGGRGRDDNHENENHGNSKGRDKGQGKGHGKGKD